jgi:tRNA dimethylallyltransferase
MSLEEAILLMKRRTRVFVRRQANWFKENDPQINWIQAGMAALDEMGELIRKWLETINN